MARAVREVLENYPRQKGREYIFLNPKTARPLGSIKGSFKNAVKKSGLINFKFHDLRHTFASQLVMNGADLYVVQKLLGHASTNMTPRYAHLRPEQLKEVIVKLEKNNLQDVNIRYNKDSENYIICFNFN